MAADGFELIVEGRSDPIRADMLLIRLFCVSDLLRHVEEVKLKLRPSIVSPTMSDDLEVDAVDETEQESSSSIRGDGSSSRTKSSSAAPAGSGKDEAKVTATMAG